MPPIRTRDLISSANLALRPALQVAGWQRRTDRDYTLDISPDEIGCLGLNRATGKTDTWLELNPLIGIRHQSLEKILAEITRERFHQYLPMTVGIHLGYLMPQRKYTPWIFTPDTDVEATVKEFVKALDQYGRPFLESNRDLPAIARTMEDSRFRINMMHCYRLPLAYAMLGDREGAMRQIRFFQDMPENKRQRPANDYVAFAAEMKRRFQME